MEPTRANSLELATLFRYVSRLLARAYHGQRDGRRQGGRAHHAQGRLLAAIRENGPVSQAELLRFMDVRSSSLSELLAKLEGRGLVKRERNPDDRRSFIVTATGAADDLLAGRDVDEQAISDRLFACLDNEEKQTLQSLLQKIADSLGDVPEGGEGPEPFGGGPGRGRGFGKGRGKGRGGRFSGGRGNRR